MKTIKIDDDTFARLKGIAKGSSIYTGSPTTVEDVISRLVEGEWENPMGDEPECIKAMNKEYQRQLKLLSKK